MDIELIDDNSLVDRRVNSIANMIDENKKINSIIDEKNSWIINQTTSNDINQIKDGKINWTIDQKINESINRPIRNSTIGMNNRFFEIEKNFYPEGTFSERIFWIYFILIFIIGFIAAVFIYNGYYSMSVYFVDYLPSIWIFLIGFFLNLSAILCSGYRYRILRGSLVNDFLFLLILLTNLLYIICLFAVTNIELSLWVITFLITITLWYLTRLWFVDVSSFWVVLIFSMIWYLYLYSLSANLRLIYQPPQDLEAQTYNQLSQNIRPPTFS